MNLIILTLLFTSLRIAPEVGRHIQIVDFKHLDICLNAAPYTPTEALDTITSSRVKSPATSTVIYAPPYLYLRWGGNYPSAFI